MGLTDNLKTGIVEAHLSIEISTDGGHGNGLGWLDLTIDLVFITRAGSATLLSIEINEDTLLGNLDGAP